MNWLQKIFQPQNMLAGVQVANDPQQTFQLEQAFAQQGNPAFQMPAQAQPQQPGLMDRFSTFRDSERGQFLADMFAGWAMGQTPQQSLGLGATMAAEGRRGRKSTAKKEAERNQTVEWLKGQGLDDNSAALIASSPTTLSEFLKQRLLPDQGEGFTLGEGQIRFDAQGNQIAAGGPKSDTPPAGIREYEYAVQQGFPGTFQDWEASKRGGMSLQVDPETGAISFQQGQNIKPLTEGQSKDAVYATRAEGALGTIDQFGSALTSPMERALDYDPTGIARGKQSPEFQQARQAGNEFLQAILRKDTGAAITSAEMDEYGRTYLPMPGDGPEVLAQKQTARLRALEALKAGMPPQAILNQERALRNSGSNAGGQSGAPQAGAVEDGYRFKGGNPSDPNNWEKVQ